PGEAFRTRKPVVKAHHDSSEERYPEHYQRVVGEGVKSGCLLPLISRDRSLGVLALGRRQDSDFDREQVEFLCQVAGQVAIAVENALAFGEIAELRDKLAQEKLYLEEEIRGEIDFEGIVGQSSALRQVLHLVDTVAPSGSTVLLLGETGTGKELIARAVHDRSRRKDRTFVKLNCAAIPTGLLESELFGHERGAFTGAIAQKIGRLELADQGTLFLDEVGDIPLEVQPKLLRYFTQKYARRMEKQIESVPAASMRKLTRWHWPGNIRELENLIERAVILTRGSALEVPVSDLGNGSAEKAVAAMPDSNQREELLRILNA